MIGVVDPSHRPGTRLLSYKVRRNHETLFQTLRVGHMETQGDWRTFVDEVELLNESIVLLEAISRDMGFQVVAHLLSLVDEHLTEWRIRHSASGQMVHHERDGVAARSGTRANGLVAPGRSEPQDRPDNGSHRG